MMKYFIVLLGMFVFSACNLATAVEPLPTATSQIVPAAQSADTTAEAAPPTADAPTAPPTHAPTQQATPAQQAAPAQQAQPEATAPQASVPEPIQPPDEGAPLTTMLEVSPQPVERGGEMTVTWQLAGATAGEVEIWVEGSDYRDKKVLARGLAAAGTHTVITPADDPHYIEQLSVWVSDGTHTTQRLTVPIACPFTPLVGEACPHYAEEAIDISYQTFERGFMIAYQGKVLVFLEGGYRLWQNTEAELAPLPDDMQAPTGTFAEVWRRPDVNGVPTYTTVGGATSEAQAYSGAWQLMPYLRSNQEEIIALPDGRHLIVGYFQTVPTRWEIVG